MKIKTIFFVVISTLSLTLITYAKKAELDPTKTVKVIYALPQWNIDSTKIDNAYLILKDNTSQKLVTVLLQETEPDSSIFGGNFMVNWTHAEKIQPLIFLPPQDVIRQPENIAKITQLITANKLPRKPFFVKKDEKGYQTIDVYDTKEQVVQAINVYRQQQALLKQEAIKPAITPIPSAAAIEVARQAAIQAEKDRLEKEAAQREGERIRLEQIEKQRTEELRRQQEQLALEEKAKRKKQAEDLASEGLELYKQGQYQEAEIKFSRSIELDPENNRYFYQYGVTLYKNQNYNKALVYLRMANNQQDIDLVEKNYYMGLTHLRLEEYPQAIEKFNAVRTANEKVMSPSAAFYTGIINFKQENFTAAQKDFQFVLDTSDDARMDEQAEDYIDKIIRILQFKEKQKTKYIVTGTYGLSYDTNVLMLPDQLIGSQVASDEKGVRHLFMPTFEYRPIFTEQHELSAKLAITYMYTWNSSFQPDATLQATDPFCLAVTIPYKLKSSMFNKGYQMELRPGYESVRMNIDSSGDQEEILNSAVVTINNVFVMSDNYFFMPKIEYRQDNSLLAVTSAEDDSSATKTTIAFANAYFLNKKKTKAVNFDLSLAANQAVGQNKTFAKYDLTGGYSAPLADTYTWNASLNYAQTNYTQHLTGRNDTTITCTIGIAKPIKEWVSHSLTTSYITNTSGIETYAYRKMTLNYYLIFNGAF